MCISVHLTKYKFINLMSESSAYELWELMFLWTYIVAKISDKKLCCRKEAARCFVSVSKLCWTVFAWNGTGTLRCLQKEMAIYRHWSVPLARPRRCPTLSNPVPWQNWMAAYLGYTLRMKTLFRGWPVVSWHAYEKKKNEISHSISNSLSATDMT